MAYDNDPKLALERLERFVANHTHHRQAKEDLAYLERLVRTQRRALGLATAMLIVHEPGDSRAVSDEFVTLAAIECGHIDDKVLACLDIGLAKFAPEAQDT